jgi:tetratricopeptide (TPR) repeat protein
LKAEEFARRSIAADSSVGEGHTWLAAALGSLAMDGSASRKVKLAREVKSELDQALALNPDDDAAHSILGSFFRALGNVSWIERQLAGVFLGGIPQGGYEEAEKELLAAIRLAPNVFRHHFELGRLYKDWDRPKEAAAALTRATEIGPVMAADKERVERAREMIFELSKEG